MELKKLLDMIQQIDTGSVSDLQRLAADLPDALRALEEINDLGTSLLKISKSITGMKDVKDEAVGFLERIIDDVINISIEKSYIVGYDAMRSIFSSNQLLYRSAHIDANSQYPLGPERPIKRYLPAVGEDCDVIRPYITSIGYCNWTRCTVLEVEGDKFTIQYANTDKAVTVRENVIFAPLGERTLDHEWRMGLDIGSQVESIKNRIWYKSVIVETGFENGSRRARVSFRRFSPDGDRKDSEGNFYFGLDINEDEWMDILSGRIQPPDTMVNKKLCYYSATCEEIIIDDSYETLFKKQYEEKPFHAIMRMSFTRSLSYLHFVNTFTLNNGFEKLFEIMQNPQISNQVIFNMLVNVGNFTILIPRLDIFRYLPNLYNQIHHLLRERVKSLNVVNLDMAFYALDSIGRRIFSISEVYDHLRQLREFLILEFLQLNMEKQMLALRYIYDIITPGKKPYSEKEKASIDEYLHRNQIFKQLFQNNVHEQILWRSVNFFRYLLQRQLVGWKEVEELWNSVPLTDQRGRAIIEKVLAEVSRDLPIDHVEKLLTKLLNLKETELTLDNLNLLRQLKNRQLTPEYQKLILTFLWEIITEKALGLKESIQQEVEKVFKVFVSGIKNPTTRVKVLQSILSRFEQVTILKNQLNLLKEFILSYPEKQPENMPHDTDAPVTIYETVNFLKKEDVYGKVLKLFLAEKNSDSKKEYLDFLGFLFEYDHSDISDILQILYQKFGPTEIFLKWLQKISDRVPLFIKKILMETKNYQPFQNLSNTGFQALQEMILNLNKKQGNIRIVKTRKYDANNKSVSTNTSEKKQIGPQLPDEVTHVYVLVSPSKIIGTKFLEQCLPLFNTGKVYDQTIKLLIQFVVHLDESIEEFTVEFRKDFLQQIMKTINKIVDINFVDETVNKTLRAYLKLITQLFVQTEKDGMGNICPHFQEVEGEIYSLKIQNKMSKEKTPEFLLKVNQNTTLWKLKVLLSQIVELDPEFIDVMKYTNPVKDIFNGKSVSDLYFTDGQDIKVDKKKTQSMPKRSLLTSDGNQLSAKFLAIVQKWFSEYQEDNKLGFEGLRKLSETFWKGSLFREPQRLKKIIDQHDAEKKGSLTLNQFKNFFYLKISTNPNAIWKIVNQSGYRNDLEHESTPKKVNSIEELPRCILSCPEVYDILFKVLQNPTFQAVHQDFYKLLSFLEVDKQSRLDLQTNSLDIIDKNPSLYRLSYTLEVVIAELSKKSDFYFEFYEKKGLYVIKKRMQEILKENKPITSMDPQIKNSILPSMIKILNMYFLPLCHQTLEVRYVAKNRINFLDIDHLAKKLFEEKEDENEMKQLKFISEKLKQSDAGFQLQHFYPIVSCILHNLMINHASVSSQFLLRLTSETLRCFNTLALQTDMFSPQQLIYGLKKDSLNYRRGAANISFMFLKRNNKYIEGFLNQLIKQMPTESKNIFSNFFELLSQIILSFYEQTSEQTDKFLINLTNTLLDRLFDTIPSESRNHQTDKVIMGILMTVSRILKKKSVCQALVPRKHQIMTKCLFFYGAKEKISEIQVPSEAITEKKKIEHFKNYVICKTEQTRKFAFEVVEKLHEISKDQDPNFFSKFVIPILGDLPEEVRKTDLKILQVGLKNFGSTCYMNAMIQILNAVKPFRNLLMKAQVQAPLVQQLKDLFSYLFYSDRMDYAPKKILDVFNPPINPLIQQDTTEFLNSLFDQLESSLIGSRQSKLLDEIFKGKQVAQMICHSCGAKRQNNESFFCYPVEIEGKYDLETALDGAHQGEVISDFYCEQCQNRGETTKRNIISEIPNIFFVHLRRIVFNYDMFLNMKIHTRLQFPEDLNMEPFTKEGVELRESKGLEYMKKLKHDEEEAKKFEELTLHGKEKDHYKMKLKGVIVHSGSADVGHYYSILPNPTTNTTNGWLKLDDSRTTIFMSDDFDSQCYGGTWTNEEWGGFGTSKNAYVLVYERVLKTPISIQSQENQDPEVIGYDDVTVFNTAEKYKEVWLDNHQFLVETHLLDGPHAKRFMEFICLVVENSNLGMQMNVIAEVLYKISLLSGYVSTLQKVFDSKIKQITPDIMHKFIFGQKKKTFDLLFHQNRAVRDFTSYFIEGVLMKCYSDGDEDLKKQIIDFMKEQYDNISGDVAKNWMRIDGYFRLFYRMVTSSVQFPQLYQTFVSWNLISVFIDLAMEKNSPVKINPKKYSVGTKSNPAEYRYMIETISFLLRRSYGFTGQNFETPAIPEMYLFHLCDNDVACLSFIPFYEKMLVERQNLRTLSTILQRLCIKNREFSKIISRMLLSTICSITDMKDQLKELAGIVESILSISDGNWRARAEAILGIASPYVLEDNKLRTLDQDRFVFTSTLYDIFPVECLLAYVHLYRLKNPLGCFQLIKAIVKGCSVSRQAQQFLASQPSPTYFYPTYFDWLLEYVPNFINYVTNIDQKRRKELEVEIAEVNEEMKKIGEAISESKEHSFYQSIITGAMEEPKVVQKIVFEKEEVEVVITEFDVWCVQSLPTGFGNKTLDGYLEGGRASKKVADQSTLLKIMKKATKALALKMKPVEEDEDKDIQGLFDEYPSQNVNTSTEVQYPKLEDPPKVEQPEMMPQKEESKTENQKPEEEQKKSEDQEQKMQNKKEEEELKVEELEVVDLPNLFKANYFRQLQVFNRSKTSKYIKLIFKNEDDCNVLFPQKLSFKASSKSNEKLWFNKKVMTRQWPEFRIQAQIADFVKEKQKNKKHWYKLYGNKNEEQKKDAEPEEKFFAPEAPPTQNTQNIEKTNDVPVILDVSCPICTFINPAGMPQCEICGADLPAM